MILPDLLFNSVSKAAADALGIQPGAAQAWTGELEDYVSKNGKFSKFSVAYLPVQPPPLFWDYNCENCRFWQEPNQCTLVNGFIAKGGWCVVFMPPAENKPFTWPDRLLKDLPGQIQEAPEAFKRWFEE